MPLSPQLRRALLVLAALAWVTLGLASTSQVLASAASGTSPAPSIALALLPLLPALGFILGALLASSQLRRSREAAQRAFADPAVEVDSCAAWKVARIQLADTSCALTGAFHGTYTASAAAACLAGEDHLPPAPLCSCGFHAWSTRAAAERYLLEQQLAALGARGFPTAFVLLEVELFGDVLEYEEGFRAASQDVLSVGLSPTCSSCPDPARFLDPAPSAAHAAHAWLLPSCARCASPARLSLAEVGARLGTELHFRT